MVIAGLFSLLIVIGLFISSKYKFSKSITINSDKKTIFNTLDDLSTWKKWSAWSPENDPKIEITYGDKESGNGAMMYWKGKKMGKGEIQIKNAEPYKEIVLSAIFNKGVFKMDFNIVLEEIKENEILVKWIVSGKTRRGAFAKILGRMLPKWMGNDIVTSLKVLKHLCEGSLGEEREA